MTADEILRLILQQNAERVRGFEPRRTEAPSYPPLVPPGGAMGEMQGPPAPPQDDRRQRVLSALQRIAFGLIPAQTPLSHNTGTARAQMFLRGLAGGFQKSKIAEMAQANRYGDEPGGGDYRGSGRYVDPLDQEYKELRNQEMRDKRTAYDRAGEERIDKFVTNNPDDPNSEVAKARALRERELVARERALALREGGGGKSGGSRGGGGGKMTFPSERAALNQKYQSEKTRIKAAIESQYGPVKARNADPEERERAQIAQRAVARAWERVALDYQRLLDELAAKYGTTIGSGGQRRASNTKTAPAAAPQVNRPRTAEEIARDMASP